MRAFRLIPHLLLVVALAMLVLMFREWAYVTTYRLYLNHRVDDASSSGARQRFDLDPSGVVPRIIVRDERMSFRAAIGQNATIRAQVTPTGPAGYEVHVRRAGADTLIGRADLAGPASVVLPFPLGDGVVDIVSHGELTWSDLRIQRNLRLTPEWWVLGALLAAAWLWRRIDTRWQRARTPVSNPSRGRLAWVAALTMCASTLGVLLLAEAGLRAIGRLPPGISALRHDLGEPTDDPRWQSSSQYGRRLTPNVTATTNEWRDGDIIRMGFVPPVMSEHRVHRYVLRTDSEGFRNAGTRDAIDVAALGDSFTDALTMAMDAAWPAQLGRGLGAAVQNYGTAGFGPQQERLVLENFALKHHPQLVVLQFFAGNDIRDAERFEEFEGGDHSLTQPTLGWPVKDIFTRADTWYLTSAIQAATGVAAAYAAAQPRAADDPANPSAAAAVPSFDRGVFTVPVRGHTLRWALMPPYLALLNYSEHDIAARRGWVLALENIRRMQRDSAAAGARFVLMFVPYKSQVYLPLLQRTFSDADLATTLHFYLPDTPALPDMARFAANRLAQNTLMQRFCEQEGIPFLDLTPVLQQRIESGEDVYFQDDSHLNEAGEALTAATLADFLRQRSLIPAKR